MADKTIQTTVVIALCLFAGWLDAPGAGGGGGRGGGGCGGGYRCHNHGHNHHRDGSNSSTPPWVNNIILAVLGGIVVVIALVSCVSKCKRVEEEDHNDGQNPGNSLQQDADDDWLTRIGTDHGGDARNVAQDEASEGATQENVFVSGDYSGSYEQYGKKYGMYRFKLSFDDSMVSGSGCDCVGSYNVNGKYSEVTRMMTIYKTYILGTGDPSENLGHSVRVQLEWIRERGQFEGKWCVNVPNYSGNGMWYIKRCVDDVKPPT